MYNLKLTIDNDYLITIAHNTRMHILQLRAKVQQKYDYTKYSQKIDIKKYYIRLYADYTDCMNKI